MTRLILLAGLPLLWAAPALAQQGAAPAHDMTSMPGMANMPGMKMAAPAKKTPAKKKAIAKGSQPGSQPAAAPNAPPQASQQMPAMNMPSGKVSPTPGAMPGMDMSQSNTAAQQAGHDMPNMPGHEMAGMPGMSGAASSQGEPPIPQTPSPPPATDRFADRFYDPATMEAARHEMQMEMGAMRFSKVMTNLLEYQSGSKGGGYRWDGQAWFGGDINRLVLKSEGEGNVKEGLETGEVQALYSRAIARYTDLQLGVRQDFSPRGRTYLALGAQSLFPFWFDVEGSLFLSTKGELLARAEGYEDFRLTQRLVLQPRAELNFAAQNTPETRTGSGLSNAELGLRLRYEIRREFAPYIGVSYDRRLGKTADYVRAAGEAPASTIFVVGLRAWF